MKFDNQGIARLGAIIPLPSGGKDIEIHLGEHDGAATSVWTMADDLRTVQCEEQTRRLMGSWNCMRGLTNTEVNTLAVTGGVNRLRLDLANAKSRENELKAAIIHARTYLGRETIDAEAVNAMAAIFAIALGGSK